MQKLRNQQGFSILDGILVVIALAVIGTAGYFAYQAHQTKKVSSVKPPAATHVAKVPAKTPVAPAPNYLVISQLGLKFQTTGLANLVYSYTPSAGEGDSSAFLSTVDFSSNDFADCYAYGGGNGALGSLIQTTQPREDAVKVGQYYYFHTGPQSACTSDSLTAEQQSDVKILVNDLETLQAN